MNPYTPPRAGQVQSPAYPPPGYPLPGYPIPGAAASVTDGVIDLLRQTRPWVQFIGALCFLGSALMLFVAVAMMAVSAIPAASASKEPIPAWLGLIYLPLAAIYIYPGIKLWAYGNAISRLVATRAPAELESALRQQKAFWKFSGISAIALMAVYAVGFAAAIVFGIMQATTTTTHL